MTRRKGTTTTADTWNADAQEIISRLDQLRATVVGVDDIAATNLRPTFEELAAIANAVTALKGTLAALKREASGPNKKWKASQKPASLSEAENFKNRL